MLTCFFCSDFSSYQVHRHKFVPGTPSALANSEKTKILLKENHYPIADGLDKMFPTLIGKGMKYFELQSDDAKGVFAKSEKPLKVSNQQCYLMTYRSDVFFPEDKLPEVTMLSWDFSTWLRSFTLIPLSMAFWPDHMEYLREIIWKSLQSI